jgi:hypothetical protein
MGLIGKVLSALRWRQRAVLMMPATILYRPMRWPRAISRYRATPAAARTSSTRLRVDKLEASVLPELDLTSWSLAFNGADPVRGRCAERLTSLPQCPGLLAAF